MLQTTTPQTVSTAPKTKSRRAGRVTVLESSTKTGKRYERPQHIEAEIRRMLALPESEWIPNAGELQNETLVFLIRRTHRKQAEICGHLLLKLQARITTLGRRFTQNLDPMDEEDVMLKLEMKVIELVLTPEQSRKRDFLEIAFGRAANRLAVDILKRRNSPDSSVEMPGDTSDEHGDELVVDDRPGPEMLLLDLQHNRRQYDLAIKAYVAVTDSRHREAVLLHYGYGMPVTTKQRGKPSLQRRFRKDPRQIRYWISTALSEMRAALGVNSS